MFLLVKLMGVRPSEPLLFFAKVLLAGLPVSVNLIIFMRGAESMKSFLSFSDSVPYGGLFYSSRGA